MTILCTKTFKTSNKIIITLMKMAEILSIYLTVYTKILLPSPATSSGEKGQGRWNILYYEAGNFNQNSDAYTHKQFENALKYLCD